MKYRHKISGNVIDAIRMWDAGEARFQVYGGLRWQHGDYIAAAVDINPPTYRTFSAEEIKRDWEPIEPAKGGVLPEGTYLKVGGLSYYPANGRHTQEITIPGVTDDPMYVRVQSVPLAPVEPHEPVVNLHLHIEDARDAAHIAGNVIEGLRKAGVKI